MVCHVHRFASLDALLSGLASAFGGERSAVRLGDPLVRNVVRRFAPTLGAPPDNYMTYAVGNAIFARAGRQLRFGWGSRSCFREEHEGQSGPALEEEMRTMGILPEV